MTARPRPEPATPLRLVPQKRAAVYVRVSDPKQEDNASLETQEAACREYATGRGYAVADVYREVHTGYELWERPQMTALRDAVRGGELNGVVIYALDRLSRKQAHVAILADECERAGVDLLFVTEEFEKTAVGEFIRGAKAFAAELEREKIKERTQRGKRARVLAGRLSPSSVPLYGYRWEDGTHSRYSIDPATGAIVRRIFAEAAHGRTLRSIATGLNDDGIPTARGKRWDFVTVRYMLRNEAYVGRAYAYRTRMVKEPGRAKPRKITLPREEWIALPEGTIPPLVAPPVFDAVQERLRLNQQRATRNARDPERYLLRGGYIRCGECGWTVFPRTIHGDLYYGCKKQRRGTGTCQGPTIAVRTLDAAVWDFVWAILTDPTIIERELRRLREEDPTPIDLVSTERSLADVARRQGNLVEHLADIDDPVLADTVKAKLGALGAQRRQLEQERADVLARREAWDLAQRRLATVQEWCRTVAGRLDRLDYAQRRLALDALAIDVKLYAAGHTPRYVMTARLPLDPITVDDSELAEFCVMTVRTVATQNVVTLRWTDADHAAWRAAARDRGDGAQAAD